MDGLTVEQMPERKLPTMVAAFAGWPDAAESATGAVQYLVKNLPAHKFAEIDPEEFYDFTVVRPETRIDEEGERVIRWPVNEFHHYSPEDESRGMLLFAGTEPSLRWRAFSTIVADFAEQCGVRFVVSLGGMMDAVPHTREPKVTGRASSPDLAQKVEWLGIRDSGYQGPTGIHTSFLDASVKRGMAHASIWGHSPHYVTTTPNPMVSYSLLSRLRSLVEFDAELDELRKAGEAYQAEVNQAIAKQSDVTSYVRRLEQRYDAANASTDEIPSSDDMVQELEDFLKSQQPPTDLGADS